MDDLRPDAVAARVAAWHNRHPLARRITSAQVQAIGFVALPFVERPGAVRPSELADVPTLPLSDATLGPPPAGSALRARVRAQAQPPSTLPPGEDPPFDTLPGAARPLPAVAPKPPGGPLAALKSWWARHSGRRRAAALVRNKARLRAKALKPAFSETLLPGLSSKTVARWALRHGRLDVRRPAAHALRRVLPDARLLGDSSATTTLYLATAAVEVGSRRARVLLGDGPVAGAIGARLYSTPRVLGSFAALALAASVLVGPPLPQVQDLAHLPETQAWQTAMAWLRHHSGNDPALQTAGPRLATAASAASAPDADAAAPAPATESVDAMPPVRMADATHGGLPGGADHAAGPAAGQGAGPAAPPGQAADRDPAPAAQPAPGELEVRMADAPPPRRAPPPAALFPDDPPPGAERMAAAPGAAPAATAPAAAASSPIALPGKPQRGGIPSIKPELDEATKVAARKAVADLRAARGEPVPQRVAAAAPVAEPEPGAAARPPANAPAPAPEPAAPPAPAPMPAQPALRVAATGPAPMAVKQAAAGAPAYALSTRLLRTRAESEQVMVAWRALLAGDPRNPLNVSVMPAGEDWRVVCWPFTSRQDAERARGLLAARGLKAETIDF
jgi:hypothetical protein